MRQAYDYWQDQPGFCVPSAACCRQRLRLTSSSQTNPLTPLKEWFKSGGDSQKPEQEVNTIHKTAATHKRHQHGGLDNVEHLQCNKSNASTCGLPVRRQRPSTPHVGNRYSMAPPGKLASTLPVSPGLQPNGCRITSTPGRKQKSALDAQDNQAGDPQLQPKEVTRGHLLSQQMPKKVHPAHWVAPQH